MHPGKRSWRENYDKLGQITARFTKQTEEFRAQKVIVHHPKDSLQNLTTSDHNITNVEMTRLMYGAPKHFSRAPSAICILQIQIQIQKNMKSRMTRSEAVRGVKKGQHKWLAVRSVNQQSKARRPSHN